MKKLWIIAVLALFLTGCGEEPARETVSDTEDTPVVSAMQGILVQLPPELTAPTLQDAENGKLYICDDYTVTVQTVEGGDLNRTVRACTGMDRESLQIMQTQQDGITRYQWVWAVGGETGIQVGRGCILDDGAYHYVITAMADEAAVSRVQTSWKDIFSSFRLSPEREEISTGS